MTSPTCSTCRFYVAANSAVGDCHRYPPQVVEDDDIRSDWPGVRLHCWCGEHKPKPGGDTVENQCKSVIGNATFGYLCCVLTAGHDCDHISHTDGSISPRTWSNV